MQNTEAKVESSSFAMSRSSNQEQYNIQRNQHKADDGISNNNVNCREWGIHPKELPSYNGGNAEREPLLAPGGVLKASIILFTE